LDDLDIKIFRALIAESALAPSHVQVMSSLRGIARNLGSDDMTIRNRYAKLQEVGCMSVWKLVVNPTFFGYKAINVRVEVQPESAKADMMRKLRLIHGVVSLVDYMGATMRILLLYGSEEARSQAIELISRITNAEKVTLIQWALPRSETKRLRETDVAIIRALAADARKSHVAVAKELGLSRRTVKNRIEKLRGEKMIFAVPELDMGDIRGLVPAELSYSYASNDVKDSVDRAMLSHFYATYLWGRSDSEHAFLALGMPSIAEAQRSLNWAREEQGVASVRLDIALRCVNLPDKMRELLSSGRAEHPAIRNQ
jgi:DNA-binding Lrp family transcriptional regulator